MSWHMLIPLHVNPYKLVDMLFIVWCNLSCCFIYIHLNSGELCRRVCYLYVTCMLLVCNLYVTCMFLVCYLYVSCMLLVCNLYVTCM